MSYTSKLRRCCAGLLLLLPLSGGPLMAGNVEEPSFTVLKRIGEVEIRRYDASVEAVTSLRHSGQTSTGFRRLAGYIFGGNADAASIAMTAPVQETLGQDTPLMAFTMPSAYALQDLPLPDDEQVELRERPARVSAVIGFSGWATPTKVGRMEARLAGFLAEHALEARGDATLNQYNPPWTLPFLRRNEVAIDLVWSSGEVNDLAMAH